jgi:predicted PurR-regulated permease PerM
MGDRHRVLRVRVVLVGVLWLIIPTVVSQIAQFVKDLPTMVSSFQRTDLYAWLHDQFGAQVPELLAEVQKFLTNPANIATIGGACCRSASRSARRSRASSSSSC